jgi:hypothetical protein
LSTPSGASVDAGTRSERTWRASRLLSLHPGALGQQVSSVVTPLAEIPEGCSPESPQVDKDRRRCSSLEPVRRTVASVGWTFELTGDDTDLGVLGGFFPARPVHVRREGTSYILEADSIDALDGDDAVEHLDAAEVVLTRVNGWAISADPAQRPVRLSGSVVSGEGRRHAIVRAGTAEARWRVFGPAIQAEGAPQPPPAPGPRVVAAAETNTAISDVLTLVGSHPHDFYTLYKIFEIIEHEAAAELYGKWTTKSEAKRFTMSANSRAASGMAARHAILGKAPKDQPMAIEEGRQYVLQLADKFLRSRLHGGSSRSE